MASLPVTNGFSEIVPDDVKNPTTAKSSHTSEKLFETPISTLQEYCRKLGKTPQYDLTALEGKGHQPLFVYRCMVGDISASGIFLIFKRTIATHSNLSFNIHTLRSIIHFYVKFFSTIE